jgi:hypothetical protein
VKWPFKTAGCVFMGPHSVPLSITAVGGIRRWTCLSPPKADEFSASRQQREAQGSPKGRDSGVPFGVRFWASKNEQTYKFNETKFFRVMKNQC